MIGIVGGTFDPVHYGHLKPARDVKNALNLTQVRFIPNQDPPHRKSPWLSVAQRKHLLALALQEQPDFVMDERELNRTGKSYMIDTLRSLKQDFPDSPLCLILGTDAVAGLKRWHQSEKILTLCHIVVTQRPGYRWDDLPDNQWLEQFLTRNVSDLKRKGAGRILLQSVTQVDLSASKIRRYIEKGQDISQMVPQEVFQQLMNMTRTTNIEAVDDD